jgi:pimeloyl-ACP methyl ester carboxylesterase
VREQAAIVLTQNSGIEEVFAAVGRKKLICLLFLSMSFAVGGCSSGSDSDADSDTTPQTIAWAPCPEAQAGTTPNLECGTLNVPLDWSAPAGEKITIGLMRSKATDTAHRLGSIVINPGGPGSSAFSMVTHSRLSARVRAQFDVVAMDPRGVGQSTQVKCPVAWSGVTLQPQTETQFAQMAKANADYYQACKQATGSLIDHVDTISVAHDLDEVRKALGDNRLNFVGFSYGTAMAETYARLYPKNVRALVLDGVLDYSLPLTDFVKTEADASEDELARFAAKCQSDSTCPLYGQDALAVFDQVVTKANAGQLKNESSPISAEVVTGATGSALTSAGDFTQSGWAYLANALKNAQSGDGAAFANLYDFYQGAQRTISCLDKPVSISNWTDYQPIRNLSMQSPHLAANVQTFQVTSGCVNWGAPALSTPVIQTGQIDGGRMLLVTATHDPSTPAAWAESVQTRLPGSALIYRDGDGHVSYPYSTCIQNLVDSFLFTTKLPVNGQRCEA